jgi:CHAT domain-containing protein/tetratricopeptide (TPR) repeat protein
MIERDASEEQIMNYLLGNISEAEREQLEQRLLTDDDFFAQVERLESELADEYAQGQLSAEERQRFEEHFLRSEEGREQTAFAALLVEYAQRAAKNEDEEASPTDTDAASDDKAAPASAAKPVTQKVVPFPIFRRVWANPYLRMAASLVIVAGLGLLIYRLFIYQSDVDKGLAALKKAYKSERPTEARITGFDYAPYSVTRGSNDKTGDTLEKERAERILLDAVHDHPGAESYYGLGKFYLADKRFDKAIEQFNKALQSNDKDARIHADMGAAYLERGKTLFDKPGGKAVESFAKSIEHLSRALELNENLLDARFNYAMALQQMGLPQRAKEEWQKYLEKDPQSKWADEAREKLKALEEQIKQTSLTKEEVLAQFMEAYRNGNDNQAWEIICRNREPLSGRFVTEQLLDDYLNKKLNGEEAAAQEAFKALTYASNSERQRADEHYPEYLVNFYSKQSIENLQRLKEARDLIKQGHSYYFQGDSIKAIEAYHRAESNFASLGAEAGSLFAEYCDTYTRLDSGDAEKCLSILRKLIPVCEEHHFKWLQMRCLASIASGLFLLKQSSESLKNMYSSLDIGKQIKDQTGISNTWDLLIKFYSSINNSPRCLDALQNGIQCSSALQMSILQQFRRNSTVANTLNSANLFHLALEYQIEALKIASLMTTRDLSVCYSWLAGIYLKMNKIAEAKEYAQLGYATANSIKNEEDKNLILGHAALYLGNVLQDTKDFNNALANYSRTIDIYSGLHIPVFLYQAHKGRLFCYIAEGNRILAESELDATLNILEDSRLQLAEAENRNSFFDTEQTVYDLAINYQSTITNNFHKAFEYSEMSRARSLLDMVKTQAQVIDIQGLPDISFINSSTPLSLEEIQKSMPEQTQLIQYSILKDNILISLISKSRFENLSVLVSQEDLEEKVKHYIQLISHPPTEEEQEKQLAKELFDILFSRIEPLLNKNQGINIIADKILNTLPFEALISTQTNRYLIEDYQIGYAPSATLFVLCSEEAKKRATLNAEKILCVGNPTLSSIESEQFAELRAAEKEAQQIGNLYNPKRILIGKQATKTEVQSEMQKADIIHLAAHSILDEFSALKSKILLAKNTNDGEKKSNANNFLESQELYQMKMPRTRLVVLSSCQSGIDRYYKGEGMLSMIRPFLVAGVPLVIASLWQVDSDATAELMITFHTYRKGSNLSSIEALRKAKIKMIQSEDHRYSEPYYWAAFMAMGGYTNF